MRNWPRTRPRTRVNHRRVVQGHRMESPSHLQLESPSLVLVGHILKIGIEKAHRAFHDMGLGGALTLRQKLKRPVLLRMKCNRPLRHLA